MCTDAKQKVTDAYTRLTSINLTSLLGALYSRDVITTREKQIIHTISIESDKMAHLLDNVIIPSLEAGTTKKLKYFLEVMEESDDPVVKSVGRRVGTLNIIVESYYTSPRRSHSAKSGGLSIHQASLPNFVKENSLKFLC